MSPKFQVYKDAAGKTRFRLRANNNKIVAFGEAYEQYASCINGIRSVQRNSGAPIEDLTIESGPKVPNPKYQIYKDASGDFRFRLKAANGETIAQGEGYESMESCLNGIEVVRNSANASIEDPFSSKAVPESKVEAKIRDLPKSMQAESKPEATLHEEKREDLTPTAPTLAKAESKVEAKIEELPKPPQVESTPEVILREEEKEDLTPAAPILSVKKEIVEDHGPADTELELYSVSGNIAKGDKIALQGRLQRIDTKQGISGAKIRILERDKSILGDDYLAFGNTAEDGSFDIKWKARPLSWRKNTGDIYAIFGGNEKAKPSRSTTQTITVK